jgi:hypothetical protein
MCVAQRVRPLLSQPSASSLLGSEQSSVRPDPPSLPAVSCETTATTSASTLLPPDPILLSPGRPAPGISLTLEALSATRSIATLSGPRSTQAPGFTESALATTAMRAGSTAVSDADVTMRSTDDPDVSDGLVNSSGGLLSQRQQRPGVANADANSVSSSVASPVGLGGRVVAASASASAPRIAPVLTSAESSASGAMERPVQFRPFISTFSTWSSAAFASSFAFPPSSSSSFSSSSSSLSSFLPDFYSALRLAYQLILSFFTFVLISCLSLSLSLIHCHHLCLRLRLLLQTVYSHYRSDCNGGCAATGKLRRSACDGHGHGRQGGQ